MATFRTSLLALAIVTMNQVKAVHLEEKHCSINLWPLLQDLSKCNVFTLLGTQDVSIPLTSGGLSLGAENSNGEQECARALSVQYCSVSNGFGR